MTHHIRTIEDFQRFSYQQQQEILKAIQTKDHLDKWLYGLNNKTRPLPGFVSCKDCAGTGQFEIKDRDNSDVHPSQIHKCVRALWYTCNGQDNMLEEKIPAHLRMIFDLGHSWHGTVQGYGEAGAWGDCGYQAEPEIDPDAVDAYGQPLLPQAAHYWIRGHADALLDHYYIPNVPTVGDVWLRLIHEYKTINSGGYNKLTRPKPEHKWQATIYAAVFNVPVVVYLYLNKDNCQQIDYPIPFDWIIWQEITEKIEAVKQWSEYGQPPDWPLTSAVREPSECRDCGFRKHCQPPIKGG